MTLPNDEDLAQYEQNGDYYPDDERHSKPLITNEEIKGLPCGTISATKEEVAEIMPEVIPVVESCPKPGDFDWLYDIKVHMLMPGQWPCIPGWHQDFVPRDEENRTRPERIPDPAPPMYLWVSGSPLTEFKEGGTIEPRTWIEFTQHDVHRGTRSDEHQWRMFIRAAPRRITPDKAISLPAKRRHSQVYLPSDFDW